MALGTRSSAWESATPCPSPCTQATRHMRPPLLPQADLATSSVVVVGAGDWRQATFTPLEPYPTVRVCLSRDGRQPLPVGPGFSVHNLTYSLQPSHPTADLSLTVVVFGVNDFGTDDRVVLRMNNCSAGLDVPALGVCERA